MTSRNDLKQWFKDFAAPTGAQFASLMDSFWHKTEDLLPIIRVDGLPEALAGKASTEVVNTALQLAQQSRPASYFDEASHIGLELDLPNGKIMITNWQTQFAPKHGDIFTWSLCTYSDGQGWRSWNASSIYAADGHDFYDSEGKLISAGWYTDGAPILKFKLLIT
jgi:hypothetical protein